MTNNPKRLAITIKGGVSLGAYEAGVIAEVLELLDYNNSHSETPWYIDVLSGASAGSITARLLATALIDKSRIGLVQSAWTNELSWEALSDGAPANTLLNSGAVEALASRLVGGAPARADPHPALRPNQTRIGISLTLSSVGEDLEQILTAQGSLFRFADQSAEARFDATIDGSQVAFVSHGTGALALANASAKPQDLTGADAFEALRETAIASGAFPFAFAPRALYRWTDDGWMKRVFMDGGVYDNEPVGKTINLAHEIDWDKNNSAYLDSDRRFLVIVPEPMPVPGQDLLLTSNVLPPDLVDIKPLDFLGMIMPEMLGQLSGSGLLGIQQINQAIVNRTQVLGNIEYVIHTAGGNLNIDNDLLGKLVEGAARARHLESNIQFFRDNFIEDLRDADRAVWGAARALPDDRKKIFVSLGLLIDFASNLADKVKFNPIVVAPAEPLTGDPLYGFSGFFLNEIRTSDFIRGMKDTYETWKRVREVSDPDFKIDPSPQFPADPLPPDWKNIPAFRDRYDKAQHEFESRIGAVVGGAIAGPIFGRLVAIPVQFLASQFLR